jgi:citrate lyase synthetase
VDHLFVFVIEEDLSFFSFKHRFEMVSDGLAHLPNVTVLRGGRYICTQLTYPEYFSKDDVSEVKADASMEAWFFSEYIAKAMGISVIFLGNEPTCKITQQYNAKMSEILPKYGVTVDIIPRISSPSGNIISASSVRKLLAVKDFEGISEIVPETTLRILKEHYTPREVP